MLVMIFRQCCLVLILDMKEKGLRSEAFPSLPLLSHRKTSFLKLVSVGLDGVQLIQFICNLTREHKNMFLPYLSITVSLTVSVSGNLMEGYRTEISVSVIIEGL